MSMVKSVLLLLKMEVSDDMSAAIITATISPRRPVGQSWLLGPCLALTLDPQSLLPVSQGVRLHHQHCVLSRHPQSLPVRGLEGGG